MNLILHVRCIFGRDSVVLVLINAGFVALGDILGVIGEVSCVFLVG
jgi:hypothetical protein